MKKLKKNTSAPWVVEAKDLIKWAQKELPVKYKNRIMYLRPHKYDEIKDNCVVLHERRDSESYMIHIANLNELTLLI